MVRSAPSRSLRPSSPGAVRFAAHGLAAVGDDGRSATRSELLRRPWQGITRRMSFETTSRYFQVGDDSGGFLCRVTGGAARFVARSDDIARKK